MGRGYLIAYLAVAVCFAEGTPARAEQTGVVYAGATAGDGFGGYAGGTVSLPGSQLGDGLGIRGGASAGEYRYTTNGQRIDGTYVSAEVALVMQTSGAWGYANFSAGPRITDTKLQPVDPDNRLRGTRWDAALQTDGAVGQQWQAGWFASVGVNDETYITQLRASRLVDEPNATRLGLEGGIQGDPTYTRYSAGAFGRTRIGAGLEALLGGGATFEDGRGTNPYVSVALSKVF